MKYIYRERGRDKMYKTWHSHGEYMVIYFYSDGGSLITGEQSYPIKRGALAVVAPGKYHYTVPTEPAEYERSKLFFAEDEAKKCFMLTGFFDCPNGALTYAALSQTDAEGAEKILEELHSAESSSRYRDAAFYSSLMRLLVLCDKNAAEKEVGAPDAVSRAIRFINDNIFDSLTLEDIAAAVNMSKYHFCRSFKSTVGVTVMEYVLKTRIMFAKSMLSAGELRIVEISERCGFSSVSYFCRAFRAEVGKTPLKYKKDSLAKRNQ